MGAGIAQVAAAAGHSVLLYDAQEAATEKGMQAITLGLQKQLSNGKMSEQDLQALIDRIQPVDSLAELSPAGLVIEAIVEDLQAKQDLFSRLDALSADDCIFASNTSSISITSIASVLKRPGNFLGMHFFNPAPIMKLVEVVSGLATDQMAAELIHATATAWGKIAVHAKSTPGFIVNRIARPFYGEALRLLQEQASDAATIDALMQEAGGFRMGPFELMDLIGNDVNFAVTRSVYEGFFYDPRFMPSLIQQELVFAGRLGRKSGHGFYVYSETAEPTVVDTLEVADKPSQLTIYGDCSLTTPLIEACSKVDINVVRPPADSVSWAGVIRLGDAHLALTDGRTATRRSVEDELPNLILFDLVLDYARAKRVAIAVSELASESAVIEVAGLFQALGLQVSRIRDVPGLVVARTVAMIVNEAADAVNQGVCSPTDVDIAMKVGVNYPQGPLAWADKLSLEYIQALLVALAETYGEHRYRCSPLIGQNVAAGRKFYA